MKIASLPAGKERGERRPSAAVAAPKATPMSLERRIGRARRELQRISDADPAFEARLHELIRLLQDRDGPVGVA